MSLPQRAQVVIVGGGIVGASVAYHLTALGVRDVLLLEQGRLSSGTTWHAAGLVGQLRASESGTRLVQYSAALYQRLEAETGLGTGYKECGGVTVARTPERMVQLLRTAAAAEAYNLECEILTPAQAADRYPLLRTDDLQGAIWLPKDGTANPTDVTQSLAKGAKLRGARVVEKVRVTGLDIRDGLAAGVRTDQGDVECETLVLCAGQWTNALAATIGVTVPLHSAEHFYVVTEAIEGVHRMLPILRDPDGYTYVKEEVGGLVVGGFEPVAKPWVAPDEIPYPFEFQLLDEDWEHFEVLMESALHRLPALATTGVKKFYNGPESFTPDNQFILGAAPSVRRIHGEQLALEPHRMTRIARMLGGQLGRGAERLGPACGVALGLRALLVRIDQRLPVAALAAEGLEDLHRRSGLRIDLDDLLIGLDRRIDLTEEVELDVAATRVQIAEPIRAGDSVLDVRDRALVQLHRRGPALGLVADPLHRGEHLAVRRIGGERGRVRRERTIDVPAVRAQGGDAPEQLRAGGGVLGRLGASLEDPCELAIPAGLLVETFECLGRGRIVGAQREHAFIGTHGVGLT